MIMMYCSYNNLCLASQINTSCSAAMITFTPLSGAARSSQTTPLAYILQIDDVRILIDCGSPDWVPELSPFQQRLENPGDTPVWAEYCEALRKFVSCS